MIPAPVFTDPKVKTSVIYCIETWLRDEQIKQAIKRVSGRIQAHEKRSEPVAIVGFGPSLQDTWEQVKAFPFVISCSGSHKFLMERGIIPTWHVEVDPRPHKVALIGEPNDQTEYLISSTCHRAVFDHLEGRKILLWHVFDSQEEGQRILPGGEYAHTGGCDVGLRSMTLAAFLGFRDLHIFGLDGCGRESSHAGEHPNAVKKYADCLYDGVIYKTTPALLEAAKGVWHELDQMHPVVTATFYGDGLIQHMARHYEPTVNPKTKDFSRVIAFQKPELITPEYRALNAKLHEDNLAYGVGGARHAETVKKLAENLKTQSILDYGCGKGYLAKSLDIPIWEYDPAIPEKSATPRPADIVVCTDVLEHIEPDHLPAVLDDLRRCVRKAGYFVIHMGPAAKTLADGRNTHLIQRNQDWWRMELGKHFAVGMIVAKGLTLHVVVGPKQFKVKKKGRAA